VGFGRTGKIWAINHWPGVEPDMMFIAKATANGVPLAAILATKEIMEQETYMQVVSGGTYVGNLLACTCASTQIEVLQREKLAEHAAKLGNYMQKRFKEIAETQELIGDVRGKGLLIGIELVKNSKNKQPAPEEAARTVTEAFKKGLLIQATGSYRQVLRMIPPLILTKEEAEKAITIILDALREAERHVR